MSTTAVVTSTESAIPSSRAIIFDVFIVLLIPSVACSLVIFFYYFIRLPQLRQQSSNHVIIVLSIVLFIEALTDLPIRLYYLHENTVLIHTSGFCLFWNWNASVLNIIGLHLMALGSIERHLFIFRGPFLSRHQFLLSRLPMIFCIVYPLAFYTSVVYGSWWCTNTYDYSTLACGAPCYLLTSAFLPLFGILTHHVLPVFIIFIANIMLIVGVWNQKNRMNRANIWRKNVRMSIQLLSIAFVYLVVWIPQCVLFLILGLGHGEIQAEAGLLIYEYTGNLTSITLLLCPFVTLAGLPQIYGKIKQDFKSLLPGQRVLVSNRINPIDGNVRRRAGTTNIRTN